ncbi:MAG TPA: multicopper oxidase domain-containing protein [Candidatus Rubrimentiphilum sp.]|nr:multicopper oxidase domain-containing protein [Candidatus Rubrimentiphilum sp.]
MVGVAIALAVVAASCTPANNTAPQNVGATRPAFHEPVVLASKNGVLEVTLTAHQSQAQLDTVAKPVQNMLLFAYAVNQGTASNGQMSADNLYPAPTLQVFPGETLIVHLNNALTGLSIRDFYNPAYTAKGQPVSIYPQQLTESPMNLHVHGLHVSPKGNSDNVLIHIPPGMANTYTYHIPKSMPQGAYWYHSHLHTITASQTYYGLAGLLAIGRTDGNLPVVTARNIPIRNMVLQYNAVFDRMDGLAQINNVNWPQYVSTLVPPSGGQLANGTYRPILAPTNFLQSQKGTRYFTVWWGGALSIHNYRGLFQFVPSNLQTFKSSSGTVVAADPSLPDYKRDVQFTVNGSFEPVLQVKPGQTEIWVLANVSDMAYMNVELTETATGRHPPIAIVGYDGNPSPAVHYPVRYNGTRLTIPPASRFAIAVTMPKNGGLQLDIPPLGRKKPMTALGILYTNNGTPNPPAELGTLTVNPPAISYVDGFFVFPTQTLLRAVPATGQGQTTPFVAGQRLNAYTSFKDLSQMTPNVKRTLLINGGFLNNHASASDPKAFVYAFAGNAFPNVALIQPRLGSVEEWTFINHNNDEHPMHVHVNDFQVTNTFDPAIGLRTGPEMWGEDNANVPAPKLGAEESLIAAGTLSMRTHFEDYIGLYVMHCHRLNHEDNGLMALVNVIPAVSAYAVGIAGTRGHPAQVNVYDGNGDRLIRTLTPFPGFEGVPTVAMGDVDGDGVLDLIVGSGKGQRPQVVVYSGAATAGKPSFETILARFSAFDANERSGVSVASAQIDGTTSDNIIVGSGGGARDRINVYRLAKAGTTPQLFASFAPYANDRSGVSLAVGFVDFMSGRNSIVTAPGAGGPGQVKVFAFSLLTPIDASGKPPQEVPMTTATFMPFGASYRGGVSLSTGWLDGAIGGAQSIIAAQRSGGTTVKVYSSGSALQGAPPMYLESPAAHDRMVDFNLVATFNPLASSSGLQLATTSTTTGADLLVSGVTADGQGRVMKYRLSRPSPNAITLRAVRVNTVGSWPGQQLAALGGY